MMHLAVLPPALANARYNYFDILAIVWLIIGLFRGRARGMSQELLPLLQWLGIASLGGLFYWRLSPLIQQNSQLGLLWSNLAAYMLIVFGVHLIYLWLKQLFAEKLAEKDLFGGAEFYLGMMAGTVRFACILLVAMALMNARVATAAELAKMEKFQSDSFSDVRFPTYGQIQHDVLLKSFSGNWVQSHLKPALIATCNVPPSTRMETIAQKSNSMIDDILRRPGSK